MSKYRLIPKKILLISMVLVILSASSQLGIAYNEISISQSNNELLLSELLEYIRQPAEFERMEGILISYADLVDSEDDFGIPYNLIAEISEDVNVISIVDSTQQQIEVEGLFETHDINMNNCKFLIAPSNSYWTRDYGPWFIFDETTKEMKVVDFEYNRPRLNDNKIPYEFALDQQLNYTYMDLIHTGGNYMTDGHGISISTDLILDENPEKTLDQINQIMNQNLNIHTYHLWPDVNGEYIRHIDCWAKYLSSETILIREVPPTHTQYTEIEAAVDYFEQQLSCYNTPYNIIRVFTPNDEPYTNTLILNDKVFIPLQGSNWDDEAIETYEQAMPGYEILGFFADDDSWLSTDAIHCRIKGIPDRYMLYIDHFPLTGYNGFTVNTRIIPFSGENIEEVVLYWRQGNDEWKSIQMNLINQSWYTSSIPLKDFEKQVFYYIEAKDTSGRIEKDPFIGQTDPHSFYVYNIPPTKPVILGKTDGKVDTEYDFSFTSMDAEEEMISYYIDWGDGNITPWTDYQLSNTSYTESHSWSIEGMFTIKAKSKDIQGAESEYSITQVSLPKYNVRFPFFSWFLEKHPYLFPILQRLLKLW